MLHVRTGVVLLGPGPRRVPLLRQLGDHPQRIHDLLDELVYPALNQWVAEHRVDGEQALGRVKGVLAHLREDIDRRAVVAACGPVRRALTIGHEPTLDNLAPTPLRLSPGRRSRTDSTLCLTCRYAR